MTRIIVQAVHADGGARRWTLRERTTAETPDSEHYVTQLIDRLSWATAHAEILESRSADIAAQSDEEIRWRRQTRSTDHQPTRR